MSCKIIKLKEIANIERVKKDKIYPKNTIYIQVSACNHNNTDKFHITKKEGTLETKYAVILPKVEIEPLYLLTSLEDNVDRFFSRYVGTNINIQVDTLNNFELQYDDDLEKQKLFSDMLSLIIEMEQQEQQIIDDLKDSKQYYLTNMFI